MGESDIRITEVNTSQIHEEGRVTVNILTKFDRPADKKYKLTITILHAYNGEKRVLATQAQTRSILIFENSTQISASFDIEDPKLWWPEGQGEQNLYNIDISLKAAGLPGGGAAAIEINKIKPLQEKHLTIGLSPIENSPVQDK